MAPPEVSIARNLERYQGGVMYLKKSGFDVSCLNGEIQKLYFDWSALSLSR